MPKDEFICATAALAEAAQKQTITTADIAAFFAISATLPPAHYDASARQLDYAFLPAWQAGINQYVSLLSRQHPRLAWIELASWNGYVREKALRSLSTGAPTPFFLMLAVRRLNDWVPQVRQAAYETLPAMLKNTGPDIIAATLCVVFSRWSEWQHIESKGKTLVLDLAARPDVATSIKNHILSQASGSIVPILSQAGRIAVLDGFLEQIAHKAVQPAVRAKAYRSLLEGKMTWTDGKEWIWLDLSKCKGKRQALVCQRTLSVTTPLQEILTAAINDRSAAVRHVGGEMLMRHFAQLGTESVRLARQLAADRTPRVAARGRFLLKNNGLS